MVRESFRLQRALADMGYRISRYSGGAFKVDVVEADGSVRGLDVFGGFLARRQPAPDGRDPHARSEREWIFPLGTCTLEGRELPGAGEHRRVPRRDVRPRLAGPRPGVQVRDARESTHRRLNGWFRGTRVKRESWDRTYSRLPSAAAGRRAVRLRHLGRGARRAGCPERVVDIGCGRGADDLWFARQGAPVVGLDYAIRGSLPVAERRGRARTSTSSSAR